MPHFTNASQAKLASCHPDIQRVMHEVIKYYDFTIIAGRRTGEEQQAAFEEGFAEEKAGESLHEKDPSEAIFIAPRPIDWGDYYSFYHFAGFVLGTARGLGITMKWGGDDKDGSLFSLGHFSL